MDGSRLGDGGRSWRSDLKGQTEEDRGNECLRVILHLQSHKQASQCLAYHCMLRLFIPKEGLLSERLNPISFSFLFSRLHSTWHPAGSGLGDKGEAPVRCKTKGVTKISEIKMNNGLVPHEKKS